MSSTSARMSPNASDVRPLGARSVPPATGARFLLAALATAVVSTGGPRTVQAAGHLAAAFDRATQGAAEADLDRRFDRFWAASDAAAAARVADEIVASGATFEEVLERLRRGPEYRGPVPTGRVGGSSTDAAGREHPWFAIVPDDYDPQRRYPVRVFLHGGVARPKRDGDGASWRQGGWWRDPERVAGPDHISVFPYSWDESLWWQASQTDSLHAILWRLKRTYNVDDNRVALFGVSDGGTGVWFQAFRAPTPWASFLPFIAHPAVLSNPRVGVDGEMFVANLGNRPFLVVNGGRDRLYPIRVVLPYLRLFEEAGVSVQFLPQPEAGHDTSWWPAEADRIERFVAAHPRAPLRDALEWETERTDRYGRVDWLVIDGLGATANDADFAQLNTVEVVPPPTLGVRLYRSDRDGVRLAQVIEGSPAARGGLRPGDTVRGVDGRPVPTLEEFERALGGLGYGGRIDFEVERDGERRSLRVEVPDAGAPESMLAFPHRGPSGRVEVRRSGNAIEVRTRGVSRYRLLLSPDQFDLSQPVRITSNRSLVFAARPRPSVETLLDWAVRDADRTMLFAAEVVVEVGEGTARQR